MHIIVGVLILIFVLMILWHVMKEIGVGATMRLVWTALAGAVLLGLFGGRGDDRHHH